VNAASASLGGQVYKRVEEIIATGRTAKDAFAVVAKERKMTTSNIQQHYYRFKRKATTSGTKARTSSRKTVSKVQGRALGAAATAVGKLPAKQQKQLARGVGTAAMSAQTVSKLTKEISDDITKRFDALGSEYEKALKSTIKKAKADLKVWEKQLKQKLNRR
jgi:hypothetical protein